MQEHKGHFVQTTQKTDSAENFLFHRKKTPINHPTRNLLSKESQKI